MRHLNLVYNK